MKTYTSDLTSKPDWLGTYGDQTGKTLDTDFGFDPDGMFFIGNAGDAVVAYSVRTNFNISGHQACEIIFTADHTNFCSDQGICFYNDGQSPNWNWDPDPSRIAFSINCPVPHLYGTNKFVNNAGEYYGSGMGPGGPGGSDVLESGIYTFKVTYNPAARTVTAITYEGEDTSGTVLDTIVLHEKLMDGGPYRIGFDADSDGSEEPGDPGNSPAYFKNLTINVYETNGISDDEELNNQLNNLKTEYSQVTDLVEDLYRFSDDADVDVNMGEGMPTGDGIDPNFNQLGFGSAICIQGDGNIVVAGYSGTNDGSKNLRRVDIYGNEDESFTPPSFNGMLSSVVQMSDGRLVVGGNFTSLERFDGASNSGSITFDADYQGGTGISVAGSGVGINLPYSANIVETGWTLTFSNNSTATVNASYFDPILNCWVVQIGSDVMNRSFPITISQPNWDPNINENYIGIGGMICLNPDGSISKRDGGDIGFEDRAESSIAVSVYTIKLLGDDSVLVGGHFTHYDNVESPYLAKIGSDGVIDEGFAANVVGLNLSGSVSAIATDALGKILIGGTFPGGIKRLNTNGSLDSSFNPGTGFTGNTFQQNGVFSIMEFGGGGILVGHSSKYYNGTQCNNGLVKLFGNGSLDTGYIADLYNTNTNIGCILAMASPPSSGAPKAIVGGYFNLADGSSVNEIVRLNFDGSRDESFNSGFGFTPAGHNWPPQTNDIKLDSAGNIYVAGIFTDYNHAARFQYAKLDANGSLQEWSVLPAFKQMGINDGMDDMYDGANFLNTNLTQPYLDIKCYANDNPEDIEISGGLGECICPPSYICGGDCCGPRFSKSIPSTHTQAWDQDPEQDFYDPELDQYQYLPVCDSHAMVGDGYFGDGSSYFTAMFPGMFVLAANNINIEQFSIVGNIGSDGTGVDAVDIYPINAYGVTYTAYFKTNYGASDDDPSINHIVIVDGDGNGIDQFYDPTSRGDEHCITGLEGKTKLFFLCVGKANGVAMTVSEAGKIATKFLDVIGLISVCTTITTTYELDLSPDHPELLPNYNYDGEGNMDTAIIIDPVTGERRSIQRTSYLELTDNCGNKKVVSSGDGGSIGVSANFFNNLGYSQNPPVSQSINYTQSSLYPGMVVATKETMINGSAAESLATGTGCGGFEYIQIDLNGVYNVKGVVIGCDWFGPNQSDPYDTSLPGLVGDWGKEYTENKAVEYSTDGVNYALLFVTGVFEEAIQTYNVNVKARYIRIVSTDGCVCVTEFYAI